MITLLFSSKLASGSGLVRTLAWKLVCENVGMLGEAALHVGETPVASTTPGTAIPWTVFATHIIWLLVTGNLT
jgi:hypothetical protein